MNLLDFNLLLIIFSRYHFKILKIPDLNFLINLIYFTNLMID